MYVFRGFDRMEKVSLARSYCTIPTPNLFALPSMPMAIIFDWLGFTAKFIDVCSVTSTSSGSSRTGCVSERKRDSH